MDKTLKAFLKSQGLHPKQLYKLAPGTLIEDFLKFQKQQDDSKLTKWSEQILEYSEFNGSPLPGHGSVSRRFFPKQ